MKRLLPALALVAAGAVVTSSAMAAPANANVTSYTATCVGLAAEATSVRIERSFESPTPHSRPRAALAFHVVGTNQIVLLADTPGLLAQAEAAGTFCTVTEVNDEPVTPFSAPIVIVPGTA